MGEFAWQSFPWRYFKDFIAKDADRFAILKTILEDSPLHYQTLEIAGNRHILITPTHNGAFSQHASFILVAHYDRTSGSPGANDNSAGVFILLETACKLIASGTQNWMLIFTDKEELQAGESIVDQGAYSLALELKTHHMERANIFCFDACGSGDTLIISTTADYLLKKEGGGVRLQKAVRNLQQRALDAARRLGMAKVLLAPTPFSDDAGFLRAGLAAQTITMLPSSECSSLMTALRKNRGIAEVLINAEVRHADLYHTHDDFIPETWRILNSQNDSFERLTPKHFNDVIRFAKALCES